MRSVLSAAVLSLGLLGVLPQPAQAAQPDVAKAAAIEEMLEVTQGIDNGMAAAGQLMQIISEAAKKANPDQEQAAIDLVHGAVMVAFDAHRDEFKSLIVKVYADNFSLDEIQQLLAFYRSPIGRKLIERQPTVVKQSIALGSAWGQRVSGIALANVVKALQDAKMQVPAELRM